MVTLTPQITAFFMTKLGYKCKIIQNIYIHLENSPKKARTLIG